MNFICFVLQNLVLILIESYFCLISDPDYSTFEISPVGAVFITIIARRIMACATRHKDRHAIFGYPQPLVENQLPLAEDVFRAYKFHQVVNKDASVTHLAKLVATEVKGIYNKAGIPTIEFESVIVKVKRLIVNVNDLMKYSRNKQSSQKYQDKIKSFSCLFDISACKCVHNGIVERNQCQCPNEKKIPVLEWQFWLDQNTSRRMIIGNVDKERTEKNMKLQERKRKRLTFESKMRHKDTQKCVSSVELSGSESDVLEESFSLESEEMEECHPQNRNQYPELCKALERTNVSNRDACLIVNAALKDLGLVSPKNVVDPSKLQRQRKYWRDKQSEKHLLQHRGMVCIGFDGKIDETLVDTGGVRRKVREEHYVLVSFPDACYIDHVSPNSGRSPDVFNEILGIIERTRSTETLRAVICDGTPVNTGNKNGIITLLELHLKRPLQWLICMLHFNELPLRKLFSVVDGKTTGPSSHEGPITKLLSFDPQTKPIINFQPIPGSVVDVPETVTKDLSSDQLYLLKICLLIQQGVQNADHNNMRYLKTAQPGALSHARWLTKANRLLRLYVSTESASDDLRRLVRFVLNFYAPIWFYIRSHPFCQDGAKNFHFMVSQYQKLSPEDQNIISPVLLNNSYFCHPENLLLAGVADERETIRRFSCQQILQARKKISSTNVQVRCFDKRQLNVNLNATSYMEMIDWWSTPITPPPLLDDISDDILVSNQQILLPKYPCHSVDVERNVKDVSAVSSRVIGHTSRHGAILQTKHSRIEIPSVQTKSDFL